MHTMISTLSYMTRSLRNITICVALAALACLAFAPIVTAQQEAQPEEGTAITVYSTADPAGFDPQRFIAQQRMGNDPQFAWQVPGFGVVKQVRSIQLDSGDNDLRFTDVARFIDPTTVSFTDLTDPDGTAVMEQNFEFDLVSPSKLLEKYIGREIRVQNLTVTLLAATGDRIVGQTPEGVAILNVDESDIQLGELPGGLITKPTLVWKIRADQGGEHHIRTTYQTEGMTWRADYNLLLNPEDTAADLGAWVTLMNLSGAGYDNARLKLIAGDVQRVQQPQDYYPRAGRALEMADAKLGFEEKAFFEYHLYTLPRRTDVPANATKQIVLFPTARDVGIEKILVFEGIPSARRWSYASQVYTDRSFGAAQSNTKVDVYVRFDNREENQLGRPLPRGKVRVFKRDDADGTLEFIGEDLIDHTPKNERVLIRLGQAFDVVGERAQMDFNLDTGRKTLTEKIKVEIRNRKDAAQKVVVRETMYRWSTWDITNASHAFEKIDARTVHFDLNVPADGTETIGYTVRYSW